MANQDKVNEVTNKLMVGRKALAEWMDACVGNELLDAFAEARGVELPYHRERCLGNPNGRVVKSKPSGFFRLKALSELGRALRAGHCSTALRIARCGELDNVTALVIDDNPYLEPSTQDALCYQTIPYIDIEDFESICPRTDLNGPLVFNFLDHVWRVASSPFRYLAYLLERRMGWHRFRRSLNTEFEITEALRHADTFRQFKWIRGRASGARIYAGYLRTRAQLDQALDNARYREHAKVYRTLAWDNVLQDVNCGWAVLFLGRDMDYAYQFLATLFPHLVARRQVAILPLSRAALHRLNDEDLSSVLCDLLPALKSPENLGLRIYDVGFHGRVPARISRAIRQSSYGFDKRIEVALLNSCSCPGKPNSTCVGEALQFNSRFGQCTISRNFGISIERCPHHTGPLQQLSRDVNGATFRFSWQPEAEKARARELQFFMRAEALKRRDRLPLAADPVLRIAYEAFRTLQKTSPNELRQLRRIAENLIPMSRLPAAEGVCLAVFPFFGADLVTPLVAFKGLKRILLLDRFPMTLDWGDCDFSATASYLAALTSSLGANFSQSNARLSKIRCAWQRRFGTMANGGGHALISSASLLSLARLITGFEQRCVATGAYDIPGIPQMSWAMDFENGRRLKFEYLACPPDMSDPYIRAAIRRSLQETTSVLILKDLPVMSPTLSGALREWSEVSSAVLHDETAPIAQFAGGLDGSDFITKVPHARDTIGGPYRLFLRTGVGDLGEKLVSTVSGL